MQIDEKTYLVNSMPSLVAFQPLAESLFKEHKWVTFTWRIGEDRSLDQNAIFHVWLTEMVAHYLNKDKKQVTEAEVEGMKRTAKLRYYNETGADWMVITPIDPKTGKEGKLMLRSSKNYKTGEMFLFLTWLQMHAAGDGIVLESKGEFKKKQREQNQ